MLAFIDHDKCFSGCPDCVRAAKFVYMDKDQKSCINSDLFDEMVRQYPGEVASRCGLMQLTCPAGAFRFTLSREVQSYGA